MACTDREQRFPIRLAAHRRLHLALRGMTSEHAYLALTSDQVSVTAGTWSIHVPLADVIRAGVVDPEHDAIGVHHHRHGRWSIAGDLGQPALRLELDHSRTPTIPAVSVLDIGLEAPQDCLEQLLALRPDLAHEQ